MQATKCGPGKRGFPRLVGTVDGCHVVPVALLHTCPATLLYEHAHCLGVTEHHGLVHQRHPLKINRVYKKIIKVGLFAHVAQELMQDVVVAVHNGTFDVMGRAISWRPFRRPELAEQCGIRARVHVEPPLL